jgi:hypothetical protein
MLGAIVFVRDNLGLELHIANNDQAAPTLVQNLSNGSLPRLHPNFNPAEARRVRQLGEVTYNRFCMTAARKWCVRNPGQFLHLTGWRTLRFWFPAPVLPLYAWSLWAVTGLSIIGLILALSREEPAVWTLGGVMLFFPALYYFVQADDRYRYPIIWVSLLLGGYVLAVVQRAIRPARP